MKIETHSNVNLRFLRIPCITVLRHSTVDSHLQEIQAISPNEFGLFYCSLPDEGPARRKHLHGHHPDLSHRPLPVAGCGWHSRTVWLEWFLNGHQEPVSAVLPLGSHKCCPAFPGADCLFPAGCVLTPSSGAPSSSCQFSLKLIHLNCTPFFVLLRIFIPNECLCN